MSDVFFRDLDMPAPNYNLNVGSKERKTQIKEIIVKLNPIIKKEKPDLMVVIGDVNSTLAGAKAAKKNKVLLAHIEAGLRSFDKKMAEESNRIFTDKISDFLFTTEPSAYKNLISEKVERNKIFHVGNIMIDTLLKSKRKYQGLRVYRRFNVCKKNYAVLTIHRSENVENKKIFQGILEAVNEISKKIKIVWPVHPRCKKYKAFLSSLISKRGNLILAESLGYVDMISLLSGAKFVITDSGGIQEETSFLGVPCLTIRNNTERPITVEIGTNSIIGTKKENIIKSAKKILSGKTKKGKIPDLWDGKVAGRIVKILKRKMK
jgi:UDP-N-acetylglucosamine 2-epimerase (non-hydrolysing)